MYARDPTKLAVKSVLKSASFLSSDLVRTGRRVTLNVILNFFFFFFNKIQQLPHLSCAMKHLFFMMLKERKERKNFTISSEFD